MRTLRRTSSRGVIATGVAALAVAGLGMAGPAPAASADDTGANPPALTVTTVVLNSTDQVLILATAMQSRSGGRCHRPVSSQAV